MPILTRFNLLCSGVLNFMEELLLPKGIHERAYFKDRNALKLLIYCLTEMTCDYDIVTSIEELVFTCDLSRNQITKGLKLLEKERCIKVYKVEMKNENEWQLYYVQILIENL